MFLRGEVSAQFMKQIPPTIQPSVLELVKEYLSDGIVLDDDEFQVLYELFVYVPDNLITHRTFLVWVPHYPNGSFKPLSEV